jgi:acyl carrier protein
VLPALLGGLVRSPPRRADGSGSLARRLAGLPEAEWDGVVMELVRTQVAAVLGHASPEAIDLGFAFKDLGFDSLAAVELRNRLGHVTGLRLPVTAIFDHPSPTALTGFLRSQIEGVSDHDRSEAKIRQAVDSVSLTSLRSAGLLDIMLELSSSVGSDSSAPPGAGADKANPIDTMDLESLVQNALETIAIATGRS